MRFALGGDHAAVELKAAIGEHLREQGHETVDVGTDSHESCHYSVFAEAACWKVIDGEADRAIVVCGSGVGIGISANKVRGIRCVICSEPYSAMMSRRHNDANALAMGARVVGVDLALMIVDAWVSAEFEGGRHQTRVDLINTLDAGGSVRP